MKKEDVAPIAQLLTGIKDAIDKLEEAQRTKDYAAARDAKKEILYFQKKIDEML